MRGYRGYSEYKDSGVEWLREVPEPWTVSKFGYIKTVLTDFTANGSFADLKSNVVYRDIPSYARLVRLTDLRQNIKNNNGVWIDKKAYKYLKKSALFGGEFLLANVGAYAGLFYQMPKNIGYASLAPNMFMAKFDLLKVNHEFIAYIGQSDGVNKQLSLYATAASAQPKLNKDDFKSVKFSYPVIKEQQKIANFLDHETAKIDTLIEKQQQLIKLLKEKRQAVISHAVTKGLNPNASMKDSGVEWLGEVPEHWVIKNYRYACLIYRGKFGHRPRNDPAFYDGKYPFIQTGDVARADKVISSYSQTLNEKGKQVSQLFPAGTLVMTIAANIGDTAILGFEAYAPDSIVGFKPYSDLNLEFLKYSFMAAFPALEQTSTQSTQANLNVDRIGAVKTVLPSSKEQTQIVKYLDNMLDRYNQIEQRIEEAIKLLQERRTALISATVTGKIDVRNWQAPKAKG